MMGGRMLCLLRWAGLLEGAQGRNKYFLSPSIGTYSFLHPEWHITTISGVHTSTSATADHQGLTCRYEMQKDVSSRLPGSDHISVVTQCTPSLICARIKTLWTVGQIWKADFNTFLLTYRCWLETRKFLHHYGFDTEDLIVTVWDNLYQLRTWICCDKAVQNAQVSVMVTFDEVAGVGRIEVSGHRQATLRTCERWMSGLLMYSRDSRRVWHWKEGLKAAEMIQSPEDICRIWMAAKALSIWIIKDHEEVWRTLILLMTVCWSC